MKVIDNSPLSIFRFPLFSRSSRQHYRNIAFEPAAFGTADGRSFTGSAGSVREGSLVEPQQAAFGPAKPSPHARHIRLEHSDLCLIIARDRRRSDPARPRRPFQPVQTIFDRIDPLVDLIDPP